ncbi:AbrB/MazE/SpoVT family DNA-binding domain-containing protein [Polynucleobacter asymbioticus]|uniref:Transcriptional regulator/antitoxin, MazE n=1 Tax=Polynucleobacter asymbioticus (strain DSM 18221 / CIP 109841 / QLW-P1DMWA-1) TaxID=312153 RepID=A4SXW0_POLAQ|nr:PbsX family transcriptional regulator [Polynucleobacter asymbioticus]ABP34324.1 transcriptional regulator/antitoxin, MazE [Polynucleobacter asymbioticus QLW-P1DMWA-1]
MQTMIKKWGNSPALRLNAAVMKSAQLNIDQPVSVKVQKGRIVIEPIVKQKYPLEELLAGITAKNLHSEADFGGPVGKELL